MWATPANVVLALDVVRAWGFEYRTHLVWVKDRAGTGFYARQQYEPLFVCARGKPPMPLAIPSSVVSAPRGAHSAKPPEARALLEKMFPHFDETSRIELFARGKVPGWTVHGHEAEQ